MQEFFHNPVNTVLVWSGIVYAMKTIPMPTNDWARWIVGILQYLATNSELGKRNFNSSEIKDEPK